jgi:hypothetical protein
VRALGRAVNSAVARFPWSWRLSSGPVRRFFDSVAVGWDERVRSDSPEYLEPLVAALDQVGGGAPPAKCGSHRRPPIERRCLMENNALGLLLLMGVLAVLVEKLKQ